MDAPTRLGCKHYWHKSKASEAVFNMAIEHHVIDKECYPFNVYKVSKVSQSPPKRAMTKVDVQKILAYQSKTDMERLAIALFKFSYFTAGINFIDMAMLKQDNIVDGKLCDTRAKTKKQIIIPLQDKAKEIITLFSVGSTNKSDFIFPIFSAYHKSEVQKANRLHKVLAKVNRTLKQIGKELGLPIKLTTYVARHSFATVITMLICQQSYGPYEAVEKTCYKSGAFGAFTLSKPLAIDIATIPV